ncbi:MAG: M12 family metallopeptidase [Tannerellaceae bacterium]|nr:M12 family metallopeptidase [Tannerellaceae bacterium]
MKKELLFVCGVVLCILFTQCREGDLLTSNEPIFYQEDIVTEGIPIPEGGVEKEIMLWGNPAHVIETEDSYIFQHDIKLNKREIDSLNSIPDTRAAVVEGRKWPDNTVYYKLGTGLAHPEYVIEAMSRIQNATYIKFLEATSGINDYVEIIRVSSGIYSDYIGKKGGRQIIGLDGSESVGNVMHELCHVLGLFHEQCREDRDRHIIVNYNVMTSDSEKYQYQKYSEIGERGYDFEVFDFNSIMLYPSQLTQKGYTMVRRNDNQPFTAQRNNLSSTDQQALLDKYSLEALTNIKISTPSIPLDRVPNLGSKYRFTATEYRLDGKKVNYYWSFKGIDGNLYKLKGNDNSIDLYLVSHPGIPKDGNPEEYTVYVSCPEINKAGSVSIQVPDRFIFTDTKGELPRSQLVD